MPYEDDVSKAFARLRQDVFARRDFYARDGVSFGTIEELCEEQAEEGTHSIIDMVRVSENAAPPPPDMAALQEALVAAIMGAATNYGTVFRMSDEELRKCFATVVPSRSTIEKCESAVWETCERGTGRYALVFDEEGSSPVMIYFAGVSGD